MSDESRLEPKPTPNNPLVKLRSDGWRFVSREMGEHRGWWPNRVAYNKQRDVLICVQSSAENKDFSLSATLLIELIAALEAKKVETGTVRLVAFDRSVVAEKPVQDVCNLLSQFEPESGRYGPHWWIDAEFEALERVSPIDLGCPI